MTISQLLLYLNKKCLGYAQASQIMEDHMAARQALLKRAPRRPELEKLLEAARTKVVTDEMLREQRVSFAYGNAPEGSKITKDSARLAAQTIRVTRD